MFKKSPTWLGVVAPTLLKIVLATQEILMTSMILQYRMILWLLGTKNSSWLTESDQKKIHLLNEFKKCITMQKYFSLQKFSPVALRLYVSIDNLVFLIFYYNFSL